MILFEEDFHRENVYIHHNTSNKSFIHMYGVLKKMGIKNNCFFLSLYDNELKDINVRTLKDPSQELAARIAVEISLNPWYAIREVISIPASGGPPIPFKLDRSNLASIWCMYNSISIYKNQARQTGKTISSLAACVDLLMFRTENFKVGTYAKDNKLRYENISRFKDIKDTIPKFLINSTSADTNNTESYIYAATKSEIHSAVAQNTLAGADNLGRGMSYPFVFIDEFEYFPNIQTTYPVLMATMNEVSKQALANGLPSSVIITTTAGRLEEESCQYGLNTISKCMPFTEALYDCKDRSAVKAILKINSQNDMVHCNFSYLQLGYDRAWLDDTIRTLGITDPNVIDRDFLNIRKSGKTNSILTQELMDRLQSSRREPLKTEITEAGYVVNWYTEPESVLNTNDPLIIGLDSSENIGNDFTELYVINATDMSVAMCTKCNESSLIQLSTWISNFMITNTNTVLVPERRSTGSMITSLVSTDLRKKGINPFLRIFNKVVQHINEEPFKSMDIHNPYAHEGRLKKYLGFPTAGGSGEYSRVALYKNTLIKALDMNYTRIYDSHLITQILSLDDRAGRLDHKSGKHDDAVVAYLLACWFIYFGKNHHFYGIDNNKFLSKISHTGETVDVDYKQDQLQLLERSKELKRLIQSSKDSITKSYLERELRSVECQVDHDVVELPATIEQFEKKYQTSEFTFTNQLIHSLAC